MGIQLRPATAVLLLGVVLVVGSIGSVAVTEGVTEEYDPAMEAVELQTDDRSLWLYTSQKQSFDRATLALNVVIYEKPERVEQRLLEEGLGDWEEVEEDERDIAPQETRGSIDNATIQWERTAGAERYVFLTGDGGDWITESFEVHDGDYLGSRHHVRIYEPPDGDAEWTAMQAHDEYWDLFDARHVVTSVEDGQSYVEDEFIDDPTYHVMRDHVGGEDRVDFDGWLTIIQPEDDDESVLQSSLFIVGVVLLGVSAVRTRRDNVVETLDEYSMDDQLRTLGLGFGLIAVYMFVRLAAVGLERTVDLPPNTIAAILYPILFAGPPVTAYLLARRLERTWAFIGASLGFLTALLIDYTYLGITSVPLDILVHRGALAIALGLIAVGGSLTERENPDLRSYVQVGVLLWLVATLLPLLKHTPLPV